MADEPLTTDQTQQTQNKIQFDADQQAHIEALIGKRIGSVKSKYESELSSLQAKVAELTTQLDTKPKRQSASTTNADGETLDTLKAQISELKAAGKDSAAETDRWKREAQRLAADLDKSKQANVDVQRDAVVMAAAGKYNFYDPSEVAELTKKNIQWNAELGRFVVVGENGTPRLNSAMEEMTPEEFYADFAQKKKHLVRGDVRPGTGSTESSRSALSKNMTIEITSVFGPKSDSRRAAELFKSDPDAYRRLRAEAKRQGLVS